MKHCKSHGIAHILPIRAAFRNSIWMYLDQSMGILIAQTWSTSLVLKHVPSGKHTKNYGKSPFYSWVNQLFLWPFSIATIVYQRVCFSISGNRIPMKHKNHFLSGPVQGLFAAYKKALSMVAGGTRRRLLNIAWMGVIHYIPMKSLLDCRFIPFWTPSFPCGPVIFLYIYIYIYIYLSPLKYVELKTTDPSPISAPWIHSPPMSAATEQVFPTWMCTPQQFVAGQAWLPTEGGFWAHFCRPNRCSKVGKLGMMR